MRKRLAEAWKVLTTAVTVFIETKAASRAAALSFSSLLGIAPCVALAVLIAGFVLGQQDPDVAVDQLSRLIHDVAPQLKEFESLQTAQANTNETAAAAAASPTLTAVMTTFVTGARSGKAGVLGALSLVLVVLLLFKSIEDAFNDIWGVRKGRSLVNRVVLYWSVFTLGAILFLAAVTGAGASTVLPVISKLPFGEQIGVQLLAMFRWLLPVFSTVLLIALLTVFYRAIPNTKVLWRGAATGGLIATILLALNNKLTFLYVARVILTKSLYGSVALPLILMSSLYVFWLYILIGGCISYAVQNVHFRNSQIAWARLTEMQRERLSLVVLLTICRRFQACLPPVSSLQLSTMTKVPTQILNESLNRLVDMQLVTAVAPTESKGSKSDKVYQPARPLNRITLFEFKTLDDNLGENPMGDTLDRLDPLLHKYAEALNRLGRDELFQKPLDELFTAYPFDESRPPFQRISGG